MYNEDVMNEPCGRQGDAAERRRDTSREAKISNGGDEDAYARKRKNSIKGKEMERLSRLHQRRNTAPGTEVKPQQRKPQLPAQQSPEPPAPAPPCEDTQTDKPKPTKRDLAERLSASRFRRRSKEPPAPEKAPTEPTPPPPPATPVKKPKGKEGKAITAFGSTYHKTDPDPPLPKRRPSSSADRFSRAKRTRSKDGLGDDACPGGDDMEKTVPSQSQLRPSMKHSNVKASLSKNKLTELSEESNREGAKPKAKGAPYESTTGKRARSPYHTSSRIDTKKPASKVRIEGDPKNTGQKQEDKEKEKEKEKGEIGKDLSFFEKLQQNVKAYFTNKPSDITKFQEEECAKKKVDDGGDANGRRERSVTLSRRQRPHLRRVRSDPLVVASAPTRPDIPEQREEVKEALVAEHVPTRKKSPTPIEPQRNWFVYSVTEARPFADRCLRTEQNIDRTTADVDLRPRMQRGRRGSAATAAVSLKHLLDLSRSVFRDDSSDRLRTDKVVVTSDSEPLIRYLTKLMNEKRNFLDMQTNKNMRKSHKRNFLYDSFNFFNLLNKEFLALETSNLKINELRDVITDKRVSDVAEYFQLYKRIIQSTLPQSGQSLMNEAKRDLEHYTDLYYDLMRRLCIGCRMPSDDALVVEKSESPGSKKSGRKSNINYYEILKPEGKRRAESVEPIRTDAEAQVVQTESRERSVRSVPDANDKRPDKKGKQLVDGPSGNDDECGAQDVFLTISVRDDSLVITKEGEDESALCRAEERTMGRYDADRHSVTKISAETGEESRVAESSKDVQEAKSESVLKVENAKGSPEEAKGETEAETKEVKSARKLKTFKKIIGEGLKYLAAASEQEGRDRTRREHPAEEEKDGMGLAKTDDCLSRNEPNDETSEERMDPPAGTRMARRDGKKEKGPWWRSDRSASVTSKQRKVYSVAGRKPDGSVVAKRVTHLPRKDAESLPPAPRKPENVDRRARGKEAATTSNSNSDLTSAPTCYLKWRYGHKSSKELPKTVPPRRKTMQESKTSATNADVEESKKKVEELCNEGNSEKNDHVPPVPGAPEIALGSNNPLKREWEKLLEASSQKDREKATKVLNEFMGNVAEAWKAAVCLKDLIQPTAADDFPDVTPDAVENPVAIAEVNPERKKAIDSYVEFLQFVMTAFERNPSDEAVRGEITLLVRALTIRAGTRFDRHVKDLPQEVRQMILRELTVDGKISANYPPAEFVSALKKVGDRLKDAYFGDSDRKDAGSATSKEGETPSAEKRKIYYRARTRENSSAMKSNLKSLAEKIKEMCGDERAGRDVVRKGEKESSPRTEESVPGRTTAAGLDPRSSVYFDAVDSVRLVPDKSKTHDETIQASEMTSPNDLDEKDTCTGSKYRDAVYNKIIASLASNDPSRFNYGMLLLQRIMNAADEGRALAEEEEKHKTGSSESEDEEEKTRRELKRTCDYLSGYTDRINALAGDAPTTEQTVNGSDAVAEARPADTERRLVPSADADNSFLCGRKYFFDNALDFINSLGGLGHSLEKFSSILPNWLAGKASEKSTPPPGAEEVVASSAASQGSGEMFLENNRNVVQMLRRKIEKRQQKIQEMIEQGSRDGKNREATLSDEKVMRRVRDLRRCYVLLQKMICDPTFAPPNWIKLSEEEEATAKDEECEDAGEVVDSPVMSMLEDIITGAGARADVESAHATKKRADAALSPGILEVSKSTTMRTESSRRAESREKQHQQQQEDGDKEPIGSVTLVKINYAKVNIERLKKVTTEATAAAAAAAATTADEGQSGVRMRPRTA